VDDDDNRKRQLERDKNIVYPGGGRAFPWRPLVAQPVTSNCFPVGPIRDAHPTYPAPLRSHPPPLHCGLCSSIDDPPRLTCHCDPQFSAAIRFHIYYCRHNPTRRSALARIRIYLAVYKSLLPRDALHSAAYAVVRCWSVCPLYCVDTTRHTFYRLLEPPF